MSVGLMGAGLMGSAMVERLLDRQIPVMAYNRTPTRLAALETQGARIASSPAEVLQQTEVILLMLTDADAIRTVLLTGSTQALLADHTVIQMGTISPQDSQTIGAEITAAGGDYLEAPVLGSIGEARSGQLQIMVGASPAQFEQWIGLLQHLSPAPRLIGPIGTAAALKLALNQLIGSLTTAFAASLGLVLRQGIEVEVFMEILRQSALYAPTFDKKLQRMVDQNFAQPNFPTKHLLKDIQLFIKTAEAAGLNVANVVGVEEILEQAIALNLANEDYSALFAAMNPTL
ncbi:hydroxyacid dehydrogenase [Leptolyngbya sp. 'hensonii']|uniref:NAD(P)-dependent oxidoreductase n=1 Tax=Leptolyngbya sp. 'hensonii' TaxID=1922337 RepID=UPI00094FAD4A|nr:NAD(P)-dependent oxidoreductase [Leptolyngbya sp. 'hensonii']OLP17536.1 hydroxyacid dehydrogenase [Leptolyngbya sp. 'hensonii']